MADKIQNFMRKIGHDIRSDNPFEDGIAGIADESGNVASPHSVRLRLMWKTMKEQIEALDLHVPSKDVSAEDVLAGMEANYVRDTYHSLSIEGYRVTEGLIECVRSGEWNPDGSPIDADRKNALAARGYYQAFLKVKESVKRIMQGAEAGKTVGQDFEDWHFEMFQPCVTAGIVKASDLVGYRSGQVFIRGSKHTPLAPDAVREAMPVLTYLMEHEEDALVRAVLGHFFFVFIHPYMDGNGRTARFIMNVMLVTAGFSWRVIAIEERSAYMEALEKASVDGDIRPFARLVLRKA